MKTKVGEHKGFDIFFDSSDEKFSVEGYDTYKENKRSYNACKTFINSFVKENALFGEFELARRPSRHTSSKEREEIITVKGIHSNGNFLCEKKDGTKFQLSTRYKYDMEKWCLPEDLKNSEYDPETVFNLENKISKLNSQINEELKKLPVDCSQTLMKVKKENEHLWKNNN